LSEGLKMKLSTTKQEWLEAYGLAAIKAASSGRSIVWHLMDSYTITNIERILELADNQRDFC